MMFAEFDPQDIPEVIDCGPMKLGRCYPACVLDMDPFAEIVGYQGPVLIVHGDADRIVDVSYAVKARRAWKKAGAAKEKEQSHCHLKVLKGAGHGFGRRNDRIALGCVGRFLAEKKCL